MSVMGTYLGAFLLLLGVLVFIHELGHFLAAKFFGVKVERFSLGFGSAIFKRTIGETEYRVSWLPLGGYVKMLGELPGEELPEEDASRSFGQQSIPRRVAIALAGPAMNLVLPVTVIAAMAMTGIPKPTTLIGGVRPDSPAENAGLRPGDRVIEVAGEPTWRFEDLHAAIQASEGAPLSLGIERGGQRLSFQVVPEPREGERPGFAIGIEHSTISAILGVPDPQSRAARGGLRTGDLVTAVGGLAVRDWYVFLAALERTPATAPLELEIMRQLGAEEETIRLSLPGGQGRWGLEPLGLIPVDFVVARVLPGTPARKAGLEVGDLLVRADGEIVTSFKNLATRVRDGEGAPIALTVLRAGRELEIEVVPKATPVERDGKIEDAFQMGILGSLPHVVGEIREERLLNPFKAVWVGVTATSDIFVRTAVGIWKLVSGKVGMSSLAGPIGIGKFAGDYFMEEGWHPYLNLLAIISVNLAILNLLPIPVLDGGHIALCLAEAARGGPISLRAREIAQTGGLAMIMLLMGFAFWNDFVRYWADVVGFLQELL